MPFTKRSAVLLVAAIIEQLTACSTAMATP